MASTLEGETFSPATKLGSALTMSMGPSEDRYIPTTCSFLPSLCSSFPPFRTLKRSKGTFFSFRFTRKSPCQQREPEEERPNPSHSPRERQHQEEEPQRLERRFPGWH